MGAVLKLPQSPEIDFEQPSKHLRLRTRARIFSVIFNGLYWFVACGVAAMLLTVLFYHGRHIASGPEGFITWTGDTTNFPLPPGYHWLEELTLPYRLGFLFAGITQFGPAVMVMYHLRALFRLYAKGIVFAEENALAFKRMGQWLIIYAVTPFLSVEILTLIDLVIDRAWFHNTEIYSLGLGSILFVIAEVMRTAREIEQERDEFV